MKKISYFLTVLLLSLAIIGCGSTEKTTTKQPSKEAAQAKTVTDPSGQEITLPEKTDTVVVLAPAVSETLVSLGCTDKITGCDAQSAALEGFPKDLPAFDMMKPDMEKLLSLQPDVLFISNLTLHDQENPFEELIKAGTCVICVPSAESLDAIKTQTQFIADTMHKEKEGKKLVEDFTAQIEEFVSLGKTVTDKKKVYFEISAAPEMYSFGTGTFLNEMINIIGAENIFADEKGWMAVEGESVVAANPDVIMTSVNYIPEPVNEILLRPGFKEINAVKNKQVYYIDTTASSLPNCNIVKALKEMAEAVYPDVYKN